MLVVQIREYKKDLLQIFVSRTSQRLLLGLIFNPLFAESRIIKYFVERLDTKMFI